MELNLTIVSSKIRETRYACADLRATFLWYESSIIKVAQNYLAKTGIQATWHEHQQETVLIPVQGRIQNFS